MYTFYNVFPKRVQSLRLSKWACQGGEDNLMFTHDQNRVFQWVLTRCPFDRHASLCLPVQYIDGLHHHPAMIQPHRDDAAYSCLREFHINRLIQPNFTLELSQENAYSERLVSNQRVPTLHCPHINLRPWYCLLAKQIPCDCIQIDD